MQRFRIEVGREHDAMPKNIVGAIANEAGLDSENIGYIKLYDKFSTVDLPEGMPDEVFKHLQNVYVCGRKMRLSADSSGASKGGDKGYKERSKDEPKAKKKNKDKVKKSKPKKPKRKEAKKEL